MGPALVPRRWPGATIVCIASGPSLTLADVEQTVAFPTIAINDTYQWAPHAAVLYAPDAWWWQAHPDAASRSGFKFGLHASLELHPSVAVLRREPGSGLSHHPCCLRGSHSGIQAINLAVLFGASRVVLLGFDMKPAVDGRNHFFGEHPNGSHVNYVRRLKDYDGLVDDLKTARVEVVNATRDTAIRTFPRLPLAAALDPLLASTAVH